MVLDYLYSFQCLSLATRGTPRLYENTFFGADTLITPLWKEVETGRAPCRQQKSKNIGNIQLKNNDGFGLFVFFLVSIHCDTRHAASLRKYIFWADTLSNPLWA